MKKVNLGRRLQCFHCNAKFYDMGHPKIICPKCGCSILETKKPVSYAPLSIAIESETVDWSPDDDDMATMVLDSMDDDIPDYLE